MALLTGIIVFFCLIALLALHELGHFVTAKKFGVKVEEFGIFIPPRLIAKKIGETVYSLNLLPLGAFVKLKGEEPGSKKDSRSFLGKPIWQRALIVLGGVIAFWIIAAIILTIVCGVYGMPVGIEDWEEYPGTNPKVFISTIAASSPAEEAGIKMGDTIQKISSGGEEAFPTKIVEVRSFAYRHKGEEVILTINRGKETFEVDLVPRVSVPEEEGAMGVGLSRIILDKSSWYMAPVDGIIHTYYLTFQAVEGWEYILSNLARGEGVPDEAQIVGIVGIADISWDIWKMGPSYFLRFLAAIAVFLALFNILPIPALDGGRFLLLMIEGARGKPINPKLEARITTACFLVFIGLFVLITVKDVINLF